MLNTIAVGTDGSPTATQAVEAAIDLADRNDAQLVVISSYRPVNEQRLRHEQEDAPLEVQWAINPTCDVDTILERTASQARARGLKVTTAAAQGSPADVLCCLAAEHDADVLVIGNKGIHRRVLANVPNSVAHNAPCSVLIVKSTGHDRSRVGSETPSSGDGQGAIGSARRFQDS